MINDTEVCDIEHGTINNDDQNGANSIVTHNK